jgi:hypothetical protein
MKGLGENALTAPEEIATKGNGLVRLLNEKKQMCASPSPTPSVVKDPQSIERHVPNEKNFQDGPKL